MPGIFFFPIFGFGFVMYFLPSIIALARSKRDIASIVLLLFSGMDHDRLDRRPDLGRQNRRSLDGALNMAR